MTHVRRSIAALLCVMFCLSFVGVGTAMADDSVTPEPTESQETVPAANEEAAPSEEPAAPAGEAAPVEQSDTAEAAVTENEADPAQGEKVQAPETTEPKTDEPAEEETEPQGDEQPAPEANVMSVAEDEPMPVNNGPVADPNVEVTYVRLDCGSGRFHGYSIFNATVLNGKIVDIEWYQPELSGYKFTGWSTENNNTPNDQIKNDWEVTKGTDCLYACYEKLPRTVVLDAGEGDFKTSDPDKTENNNYTRTVELTDNKFPSEYDVNGGKAPTFEGHTFEGWWTEKPTITEESNSNGSWHYKVTKHGYQVKSSANVPENVTVLYAVYTYNEDAKVTYYYDWNGINGRYGKCLTATRKAGTDGEYSLTVEDLAIIGLNYPNKDGGLTMEALKEYWEGNPVTGTDNVYFDGWKLNGEEDVTLETKVKNGDILKASWHKVGDEAGSGKPDIPDPVPATSMRFDGTDFYNMKSDNDPLSVTLRFFGEKDGKSCLADGVPSGLAWKVTICPMLDLEHPDYGQIFGRKDNSTELTLNGNGSATDATNGITVEAKDATLTVKSGEKNVAVTVSATAKAPDGSEFKVPTDANMYFAHNYKLRDFAAATSTSCGHIEYKCAGCGAVSTVVIPCGSQMLAGGSAKSASAVKSMYADLFMGTGVKGVDIVNANGSAISDTAKVGTGSKVRLTDSNDTVTEIDVIVTGDTNGDGYVNAADAGDVLQDVVAPGSLKGVYEQAAHVSGGGSVTTNDAVAMLDMAG